MTGVLRLGIILCLVLIGCAEQPAPPSSAGGSSMRELVFLTRDGCVNTQTMRTNLDDALRSLGLPADYQVIDLGTLADTDVRGGYPTPTLLYANRDLFGMAEPPLPHPPGS